MNYVQAHEAIHITKEKTPTVKAGPELQGWLMADAFC